MEKKRMESKSSRGQREKVNDLNLRDFLKLIFNCGKIYITKKLPF